MNPLLFGSCIWTHPNTSIMSHFNKLVLKLNPRAPRPSPNIVENTNCQDSKLTLREVAKCRWTYRPMRPSAVCSLQTQAGDLCFSILTLARHNERVSLTSSLLRSRHGLTKPSGVPPCSSCWFSIRHGMSLLRMAVLITEIESHSWSLFIGLRNIIVRIYLLNLLLCMSIGTQWRHWQLAI